MKRLALLLAAIFCFPLAARAAGSSTYLGAGLADGLLSSCLSSLSECSNYSSSAREPYHLRIVGGYDLNPYFGIEGEYANLGKYDVQNYLGNIVGTVRATAITFALRGTYRFSSSSSAFGKLGISSVKTDYAPQPPYSWPVPGASNSQRSSGVVYGIGLQYDFNQRAGIRVSLEAISFRDDIYKGSVAGTNLLAIFRL